MSKRGYGQYCGMARAVEMVGERWTLLIVRDLLVAPRRYTDLREGLPRIPTNILAARLRELEQAGIVERVAAERPGGGVLYSLTPYGRELDEVLLALGRWGAKALGEPAPDEIVTADSMIMALRTTFQPRPADEPETVYELRVGPVTVHAFTTGDTVRAAAGPAERPDLVIESGPAVRALMAGEVSPRDALDRGLVQVSGEPALLARFADTFRIG